MPGKNNLQKNGIAVTVLGSGSCVPSLDRSSSALWARINGQNLLFDIGSGTIRRLLECGISVSEISYLFLSHFHPDHSGELASFLFSRKYSSPEGHKIPLAIIGGKGLKQFYGGFRSIYGHWIELEDPLPRLFEMDVLKRDEVQFAEFNVATIPVEHNDESVAFRITDITGASFVYSGDTDYCSNLIELSKDADLLICESSRPDDFKAEGHLTPSLAGEIARRANVRQLVLTHFYPECEHTDLEKQCRKTYEGPLLLAEDLMEIHIP